MSQNVRKLVAVGGIAGDVQRLEQLVADVSPDAVALVGDLGGTNGTAATFRAVFHSLGEGGVHAFWVPGVTDAPYREYLREAYNMEIAFPLLRGVHGTAALADGQVLFAGMGGEVVDDPKTERDEESRLRYPGWEVEYRLKVVGEFDAPETVLLFTTPPAHKGLHEPGSEVLAELIKTHNARVAIVAGDEPAGEELGRTVVVCPGRLDRGSYAIVDIDKRTVETATFGARAAV